MKIKCEVCNRLHSYPRGSHKYIAGEFICSKDCLFGWLGQGEPNHPSAWGAVKLPPSDAHEVYSIKLKQMFRSRYELAVAEDCYDAGFSMEYERWGFLLEPGKTYTPDLYYPMQGSFVEVKGKWGIGSKKKFELFKVHYPMLRIALVSWPIRGSFDYARKSRRTFVVVK